MSSSRQTRSQKLILEVLKQSLRPLSAQEIFLELRNANHSVGLATVYRALEALRNEGKLQAVNLGDQQTYYQVLPSNGHNRHHLICTECRRVVPLPDCPVGDLEEQLASRYQFVIEYHVLDFYGICAECRGEGSSNPGSQRSSCLEAKPQ
ncbi:Fur family transcriptional regulator [Synechococcus sp. 60AY4M2]|jgi:Fur family ferric uptake transcriptional regulator|uniref:Fur family transcriptional regulator n=1 Tax=unclassified Synechococcus TaxID=2626047 RepID=UPI000C17AF5A|nr:MULTISPECIES: transcriptional repressor [unclassified Synechococcus]PIK94190.1 Fur family transcriptional regulator [Synechococcus sp. 60AY4M2]PIK98773.1 Fur family transcriptional regulator [Synechococcus sp. 63AY4M1]PIL00493.1 Fur family transcriptional regulator [Synechococcus sp. 65AY640]